jgi:hypothetical protein
MRAAASLIAARSSVWREAGHAHALEGQSRFPSIEAEDASCDTLQDSCP